MAKKRDIPSFLSYSAYVTGENFKDDVAKVVDKVFLILLECKKSRDDYSYLIAEYFARYWPYDQTKFNNVYEWVTHPDAPKHNSIIRSRSLLQGTEGYEPICGLTYEERLQKYETTKENWYA
jgi:hypothetical protein